MPNKKIKIIRYALPSMHPIVPNYGVLSFEQCHHTPDGIYLFYAIIPKQKARLKRSKAIHITMFNDEYLQAKIKASQAGYPLVTYCRHAILSQPMVNQKQRKHDAKLLSQIARIGSNINQIAKVANTKKAQNKLEELDIIELNLTLSEIYKELHGLTQSIEES
ncbi:Bacterial mobilisation protein (MobC) [Moraxella caprae]|uniref:Bacterial mobilisation protein (MobC) n=2 Tax=Moraxella TaxID=475 RepID=A0A378QZ21_9GAMM|nr:MobC family plasmid mobilization relaxosome protein [Moraxella caprae]STZ07707.1 Bacterial mobilisation protein (MobC) [Moraxella caprae]